MYAFAVDWEVLPNGNLLTKFKVSRWYNVMQVKRFVILKIL